MKMNTRGLLPIGFFVMACVNAYKHDYEMLGIWLLLLYQFLLLVGLADIVIKNKEGGK
jgi:hypothetical protein